MKTTHDQPEDSVDSINDSYVTTAPSGQIAVDVFKGEWSSQFPPPFEHLQAGKVPLFEDPRINWLVSELGGFRHQHILELGPLEGGHSYMLDQNGAESITAIEANTHGFLKCLIAKELLGIRHVKFLHGDFVEYLKAADCPQFDIGVASGVLYHMVNPVELIAALAEKIRTHLFIWTHYYDESCGQTAPERERFPSKEHAEYADFPHTLVRQRYARKSLGRGGFCGGNRPYSNWMYRDEILKCLEFFGFAEISVSFDQHDHPHGPAFALLARRTRALRDQVS